MNIKINQPVVVQIDGHFTNGTIIDDLQFGDKVRYLVLLSDGSKVYIDKEHIKEL